jgi:hypothetical protein
MMKRILLSLFLLTTGSTFIAQPQTVSGKVSVSILRTTNKHPYIITLPIVPVIFFFTQDALDSGTALLASLVSWYCAGRLLKTTTHAMMEEFDIAPLEN